MKKLLSFTLIALMILVGCEKYDDSGIRTDIKELNDRITALENWQQQANRNISSLQSIVDALSGADYVVSVSDIVDNNGNVIGCSFQFAKGGKKEIYYNNAPTPAIGVKIHSDGIYYWTLNGEWLFDENGNKVRAQGLDGANGSNGTNGTDGKNGTDGAPGVTPKLKILDGYWYVTYDNGENWSKIGVAADTNVQGVCIFKSVTVSDSYITFVLADGSSFAIPYGDKLNISFSETETASLRINSTTEIGYEVTSSTSSVDIEVIGTSDIYAVVIPNDSSKLKGKIKITAGESLNDESKVVVLVTNGNKVIMRSLIFKNEILEIRDNTNRTISADGGNITLEFLSNLEYDVIISDNAKSWISVADNRAVTKQTVLLNIAKNTGDPRTGTVTIKSRNSDLKIVYTISQQVSNSIYLQENNGIMPGAGFLTAEYPADDPYSGVPMVVDNDITTQYEISGKSDFSFIWEGDTAQSVGRLYLHFGTDVSKHPKDLAFYYSDDGKQWNFFLGCGTTGDFTVLDQECNETSRHKYWKVTITNSTAIETIAVAEIRFYPAAEIETFSTFEDVVRNASHFTASNSTPMGNHYENKHITTNEDKIWLSTASNEPALLGSAPGYTLRPYTVDLYPFGEPLPADVNQHGIGDCSALAVFAEMAYLCPDFIKSIIKDNNDGTYTVKMFDPQGQRIDVTVQSTFLGDNNGIGASSGKYGEANWATVLEKAIMKWNYIYQVNPDIMGIGSEHVAPLFTGEGNSFAYYPETLTAANLKKAVNFCLEERMLVIGGFRIGGLMVGQYQTVTAHAYSFMYSTNTSALFTMRNPWGTSPGSSDGREDGVLDITDDGIVPPTIDIRVIYPGIAKQYAKEILSPYAPPQW